MKVDMAGGSNEEGRLGRSEQGRCVVVKIGGSILTQPDGSLDRQRLASIGAVLRTHRGRVVVVHGSGMRGRAVLKRHRLDSDFVAREQETAVREFRAAVAALSNEIVELFSSIGLRSETFVPHELFQSCGGCLNDGQATYALRMENNWTTIAVLHGGVLEDHESGYYVASGDDIVAHLAMSLRPARVIFLTAADGVYETFPPPPGARPLAAVDSTFLTRSPATYVVGEPDMLGKVRQAIVAAAHCDECYIANGMRTSMLRRILAGEIPEAGECTRVLPQALSDATTGPGACDE